MITLNKEDAFTIVDIISKAQEVIRCKDCKYCDRHHLVDGLFCYRLYEKYNKEYPQMIIEVDADDFCSRGERRGEEDEKNM